MLHTPNVLFMINKKQIRLFYDRLSKRKEHLYIACLSRYLKCGKWYFDVTYTIVKKRSILAVLPWNLRHVFNANGNGPSENVPFTSGSGKIILFYPDYVIGLYYEVKQFIRAKNNCELYYELLSYPLVDKPLFDDELHLIKMRRIEGQYYTDQYHSELVLLKLFELQRNLECIDELYVQHGDIQPNNIVWINRDFYFIDLDCIGLYPLFFDVIHFMNCLNWSLERMVSCFRDYEKVLSEKIHLNCGLDDFNSKIDYVLAKYVEYYYNNCRSISEIEFLVKSNLSNYPRTNEKVDLFINHAKRASN